ncbi:MAG: hypothetical protein ACXAC7_13595 [Candidatus Hodarchaeales archaeon]
MSFDDYAALCLQCKNFDLMITNECKLGLDTSPSRTECDKYDPAA